MMMPKRSYWIREVVTEKGISYHISFRDGQGKIQKICVPYDFYMAFRRLELDERKLRDGIIDTGSFRRLWRKP